MKKKSVIISVLFIFFTITLVKLNIFADELVNGKQREKSDIPEKSDLISKELPASLFPCYIIFGPENYTRNIRLLKGFGQDYATYKFNLWAQKQGLKGQMDQNPFINNFLRILQDEEAEFELLGLDGQKTYYLWLDINTPVSTKSATKVSSILQISINNKIRKFLAIPISPNSKGLVRITLNELFLTVERQVKVKLKCTEGKPMFWGIHDIFITSTPDLPGGRYVLP